MAAGKASYMAFCMACHQPTGVGLAGAFPPLAGSDSFAKLKPEDAVKNILLGKTGEITVNGTKYNNIMPVQTQISDQDISNIVTYIFNSWGNQGGHIGLPPP